MHEYYTKISELPFKIIISLSPDDFIERAFEKTGKPYELLFYQKGDFYRKDNAKAKIIRESGYTPQSDVSVIIKLMGWSTRSESLILTYGDFFAFLETLLKTSELKLDLNATLQDINSFLFLGFKYNKWYLNFYFLSNTTYTGQKRNPQKRKLLFYER